MKNSKPTSAINKFGLIALTIYTVTGCSASHYMYNMEHSIDKKITKNLDGDVTETQVDGKAISVDAKQRFVFMQGTDDGKSIICAEPSPDALSAIVSGVTIGASGTSNIFNSAFSNSESASSIGLRTQSIQLLRDGMYRLCEAYFGGIIGREETGRRMSRYQDTMVAILAIESLTGVVTPQQVILSGSSGASLGAEMDELTKNYTESVENKLVAEQALATSETNLVEANQKLKGFDGKVYKDTEKAQQGICEKHTVDSSQTPPDNTAICTSHMSEREAYAQAQKGVVDAEADKEVKTTNLKARTDTSNTLNKLLLSAQTQGSTFAETKGTFGASIEGTLISDASAQHISKAVQEIVDMSLVRNSVVDECLKQLENRNTAHASLNKNALEKNTDLQLSNDQIKSLNFVAKEAAANMGSSGCNEILIAFANRLARSESSEPQSPQ